MGRPISTQLVIRPGQTLEDGALAKLVSELRGLAERCFDQVPSYQALSGDRQELSHSVIAVARDTRGTMVGFASGFVFDVPKAGRVLHLGLTCIDPDIRGLQLTRALNVKLCGGYLVQRHPVGDLWVTSVACVLSSLGNVALSFDDVYPSPFWQGSPSFAHRAIAEAIDRDHRGRIFISPTARFDPERFVFEGSVAGTVFAKSFQDTRYHHRVDALNRYYAQRIDFERGDEVLQVGKASLLWTAVKNGLGLTRWRLDALKKQVADASVDGPWVRSASTERP